jgi:hypothetical protein
MDALNIHTIITGMVVPSKEFIVMLVGRPFRVRERGKRC